MVTKSLVWIFILIRIAQCRPHTEHPQDVSKISADCSQQSKMDSESLKNILITGKMPEQSETYLKFLECLYKQQNYFDEKGFVAYSTIENYLSKFYDSSPLRKAIQPCENIQVGTSLGERAYHAGKCIIANLHLLEDEATSSSMESSEEKNTI